MVQGISGNNSVYATQTVPKNDNTGATLAIGTALGGAIGAGIGYIKEGNKVDVYIKKLADNMVLDKASNESAAAGLFINIKNAAGEAGGALVKEGGLTLKEAQKRAQSVFSETTKKIFGTDSGKELAKQIKTNGDESVCKEAISRLKNCKLKSALIGAAVVGVVGLGIAFLVNHFKSKET